MWPRNYIFFEFETNEGKKIVDEIQNVRVNGEFPKTNTKLFVIWFWWISYENLVEKWETIIERMEIEKERER